jgi:hypothetical protein
LPKYSGAASAEVMVSMGLSASTKQRLTRIRDQLNRIQSFRMAGSEAEKQLAALKDAVNGIIEALLAEPDG